MEGADRDMRGPLMVARGERTGGGERERGKPRPNSRRRGGGTGDRIRPHNNRPRVCPI